MDPKDNGPVWYSVDPIDVLLRSCTLIAGIIESIFSHNHFYRYFCFIKTFNL